MIDFDPIPLPRRSGPSKMQVACIKAALTPSLPTVMADFLLRAARTLGPHIPALEDAMLALRRSFRLDNDTRAALAAIESTE